MSFPIAGPSTTRLSPTELDRVEEEAKQTERTKENYDNWFEEYFSSDAPPLNACPPAPNPKRALHGRVQVLGQGLPPGHQGANRT